MTVMWPRVSTDFVDETGETSYGIKHIGNKMRTSSMPYTYDIAEGNVPDHTVFRGLGYNFDINNVREDLWEVGGAYVFPTAGQQMELVSSAVGNEDSGAGGINPAGVGIQTISLHYLDDNWVEQDEIITLDGTTVVTTTATNIYRIQDMHALTTGSSYKAIGNIDIRNLANTPIYGRIAIGNNNMLQAVWTVPAVSTGYLVDWHASAGAKTVGHWVRFILCATAERGILTPSIFHIVDLVTVQDGAAANDFKLPIKLPAKTDIIIAAISDAANSNAVCAANFEGWYET